VIEDAWSRTEYHCEKVVGGRERGKMGCDEGSCLEKWRRGVSNLR